MKKIAVLLLQLLVLIALVGCSAQADVPTTEEAPATEEALAGETSESASEPVASGEDSSAVTGEKTKISILRPGDQEKVALFMEPAITQFMEENPDIEVEIVYESWGGWIQKYPTLFESNTQPDVIFWWDNKQNDSSVKGKLVRLNDYIDQDLVNKIPESVWNMVSLNENDMYYVPSTTDIFVLYYNKDVFTAAGLDPEAPPTTWDELLAACKAIDENTDVPAMGVPARTGLEVFHEFVAAFVVAKTGQDMVDSNNDPTFDTPEGLEAMEFLSELFKYAEPSPTENGRGELRPMLRDGQLGMIVDSAWAVPTFQEAYGENLDTSPIGIAMMPTASSGSPKATWMGTNGWVASRSETAEASAKLINFMMRDEILYQHHVAYGSIPMFEYELEQPFYQYNFWKTMYDAAHTYNVTGMIGKYSSTPAAYYAELEEVWQLLLDGQIDPQQAIDAAVEKVNSIKARQQ